MKATLYFHARGEDSLALKIQARPATSEYDSAYYELHIGPDLVIFCDDAQCRQLMDVLGSRPDLPKTNAQIDAEREANARTVPAAGDVEVLNA